GPESLAQRRDANANRAAWQARRGAGPQPRPQGPGRSPPVRPAAGPGPRRRRRRLAAAARDARRGRGITPPVPGPEAGRPTPGRFAGQRAGPRRPVAPRQAGTVPLRASGDARPSGPPDAVALGADPVARPAARPRPAVGGGVAVV